MFVVESINISGLWGRHDVSAEFNDEVNVIIGRNGTGKTTFMNVLHGILSVDIDVLVDADFKSSVVTLVNEVGGRRTIKVKKSEDEASGFEVISYQVSNKKYSVLLGPSGDRSFRPSFVRRRANEQSIVIRDVLRKLISMASLSVYRMRADVGSDDRDRSVSVRINTPVDLRLDELMQQLTHYQLDLSQQAQNISVKLQRDVLMSLLFERGYSLHINSDNFDPVEEKSGLIKAYMQLGLTGPSITKRINEHVTSIENAMRGVSGMSPSVDFSALEAKRRADKVVELSLKASKETSEIYGQINLFLKKIKEFITDKDFSFSGGNLVVTTLSEGIPLNKLSSGEKQLLILLIEVLLQRKKSYVFLADEPELSLHIAWQRRILPAVQEINPNAQVIVATHSPEIAGRYKSSTIDMEDLIDG